MVTVNNTPAALKVVGILVILWWVGAAGATQEAVTALHVNLLVVGDWGLSPSAKRAPSRQNTAQAMAEYVLKSRIPFDAVLACGDNCKVKLAGPDDPQFSQAFDETYSAQALSVPFYAVFGNHDYEYDAVAAELEHGRRHPTSRWKMPGRWYRLDLPAENPLVTVLMLDSNRTQLGKEAWQAELHWMEEELSRPRRSAWTICLGHHPLFSDGQHGDDAAMQKAWGPILKKHEVDFYISGHDHVLQQLQIPGWPTTFLTSGGGGEDTKRPVRVDRGPFVRAIHGFAALRCSPRSATVSLIDDAGTVLHAFERNRTGEIRILRTTPSNNPSAAAKTK